MPKSCHGRIALRWGNYGSDPAIASISIETKTIRKLRLRILPAVFLLFVVALLDRNNIGFAALTMSRELAISSQQFGLLFGIFFFGYFLFEIPSNLFLHKIGARVWIARILISWGIVATLTGFVHTVHQLYSARFLLGLAEAGYFPGMALYLTYWFPQTRTGASACAFDSGQSCRHHSGSAGFGSDFGSRALARRQQLAVAPDFGGNAGHSRWCADLLSAAKPPPGSQVSDRR